MSISESPFGAALEAAGITQANVATDLGVSQATVSRWCAGTRRPSHLAYVRLGISGLQRRHEAWLQSQRDSSRFDFTYHLPHGVTPEQARATVLSAIRDLADGAAR